MDTRQVVARFEAERQALALMDHPNIAKVLDAGATASGRPYFVLELVKGLSITKYADQEHLTPQERLRIAEALDRLIELYTTTNKPDEAKMWAERAKYLADAPPLPEKRGQ